MKRILFFLFMIFFFHRAVLAQEIKAGDTTILARSSMVTIMNPEPIGDSDNKFVFGETCIAKYEASITVVGVDKNRLLVRYTSNDLRKSAVLCPDKTIFFIAKSEFANMAQQRAAIHSEERNDKDTVERLLKQQ